MENKPQVYFLGIGGIGMSALARYFKKAGHRIAGYDRFQSPLCQQLEKEGMAIHYEDNPEVIPPRFLDKDQTLVIYTPAIPQDSREFAHFKEQGFSLRKRAEVLGFLSREHRCFAVAGTHGKTTTSALLAHIFRTAEVPAVSFVGGIITNYNTNFWGDPRDEIMVVEADEFDRSFLQLHPAAAAITSVDADHMDIYQNPEDLVGTFREFAGKVKDYLITAQSTGIGEVHYSSEGEGAIRAENITIRDHQFTFDLITEQEEIAAVRSPLPGIHNIENILAASALALHAGVAPGKLKQGIESFRGVRRRFEYHINTKRLVYIDDYAHHPREIKSLLEAVRQLYPKKEITAIFQPHLFSRTRDFLPEFAECLSEVDRLILMDIYPAREKPIPGVSSERLLELTRAPKKELMTASEILGHFKTAKPRLLLTIGAGDIDQIVQPLKATLLK